MRRQWEEERDALATDSLVDQDLCVKPRDPEASIRVALRDVRCPRCNGHVRRRIIALAQNASPSSISNLLNGRASRSSG
jgi:hypothetical protein